MSRKIEVQILGDSKSLEAALGRSQAKTSKFGKGLAVASKIATGALLGLGAAAVVGFKELNDQLAASAQTRAVLKSTGNAANVTAKQVDQLSGAISDYSGQDDEAVKAGENMLLTFTQIRNSAGKTNDIFTQATKVTADLSQAMGLDMKQAALQVGKALNDPARGYARLQRIGVAFTDSQVKQIKAMTKSGNVMGAQKVILGELNKEFGGSAKAFGQTLPGQIKILTETFKNLAASIVQALLPSFKDFVGVLQVGVNWMKENQRATRLIVIAIAALSAGVIVVNAVYKVWAATTKVVAAAQWLLNAALDANPVVLIVAGIIALGVALVIAYKKSQTFRAIVGAAVDFVKEHWKLLLALIPGIGPLLALVATHFKTLRNAAGAVLGFVADKVQSVINVFKSLWGWIQNVIDKLNQAFSVAKAVAGAITSGGGPNNYRSPTNTKGGSNVVMAGGNTRPMQFNFQVDGKTFYSVVVGQDKISRRQTGRSLLANG